MKEKAHGPHAARDLYVSTLFKGRRAYVERACDEWWILSAEHGLVHPDDMLVPYDATLKVLGRAARRKWSRAVLTAIDERLRPRSSDVFEVHAGSEYRDFGLIVGLRDRGCEVEIPTEGMPIGKQLQFYQRTRTREA